LTLATEVVEFCPVCHSSQSSLFDQRLFHGLPVTNRICSQCGLVYQSPRMTSVELDAFYQAEYRQLYQGSQEPSAKDVAIQQSRAQVLVEFIRPAVSDVLRHLDIGCSAGLLLAQTQKVYACQPVGIEPGEAYRQAAARNGLTVYPSLQAVENSGEARFDLVSLAHVLEHLPDPIGYLANLRRNWLAPNGWLLIEVPNLYGHDCFEIAHLISYSPHTLSQVLAQAGFQVVRLRVHGQPRSSILPLYITALAKPSPMPTANQPVPEQGVRRKRRLAIFRRSLQEHLFPSKAWLRISEG
jgi:2-polyprenyl-3-methyl-5-hydroxy-6-metoxy-1,4-benzoquinol methylase